MPESEEIISDAEMLALEEEEEESSQSEEVSHVVGADDVKIQEKEVVADAEPVTFESLGVCPELCQAVSSLGWTFPTEIQKATLPHSLNQRDVIALAETGSGKTGAFAIPIVQALLDNPGAFFGVALSPTRELCVQIGEQFKALGVGLSLKTCIILGGVDMVSQAQDIARRPHIIVASPGRLVDHLENTKGFHLRNLQYLVMDEADRLLSEDFEEALDKICVHANPRERRTFLFSATMTSKVAKLQRASLKNPVKIEVSTKYDTAKGLIQNYVFQPLKFKLTYLVAVVGRFAAYSMIIFADRCKDTQKVTGLLRELGFDAVALHGQMNQMARLGALNQFKSGQKKILVATDVASRGLDIPSVDVVINLDIPKNSKDYIHRVGRTARAGRTGRAVTIFTQYDVEVFQRIEHALGKKLPELEGVNEAEAMRYHGKVTEALKKIEVAEKEERDVREMGGGSSGAKRKVVEKVKKEMGRKTKGGGKGKKAGKGKGKGKGKRR